LIFFDFLKLFMHKFLIFLIFLEKSKKRNKVSRGEGELCIERLKKIFQPTKTILNINFKKIKVDEATKFRFRGMKAP